MRSETRVPMAESREKPVPTIAEEEASTSIRLL
jgi:hypothetical protein